MIRESSTYYRIACPHGKNILPFIRKHFDLAVIIPEEASFEYNPGTLMHLLFDIKNRYTSLRSMLIVYPGYESSSSRPSCRKLFWDYFQTSLHHGETDNVYLLEIDFPVNEYASRILQTMIAIIRQASFEQILVYSPSSETAMTRECSERLTLLIENSKQNRTDLNLAAHVIPFYRGFAVNNWITPISYLFGRTIRNAAAGTFVLSKHCFNFWLKIKWPDIKYFQNCFFFLNISAFTSGLKINEFFLGEGSIKIIPEDDEYIELIKTGLYLADKYKTFIRNCMMLLTCQNKGSTQIPFTIYSTSDISQVLSIYDSCKKTISTKFSKLLKKNLGPDAVATITQYFKTVRSDDLNKDPDDLWNLILLSLIEAYISSKSPKKRSEIIKIFMYILSIKPGLWANELRSILKSTREKALADEKQGIQWYGGESGQNWHIHDLCEKRLHETLSRLHSLKSDFF